MTETTDILEKNHYELTFLLNSENAGRIVQILQEEGASIVKDNPLQKVSLAYPIKKSGQSFLGNIVFYSARDAVRRITARLKLEATVLRFLISRAIMVESKAGAGNAKKYRETFGGTARKEIGSSRGRNFFEETLTNEALQQTIEKILKE